MRLINNDPIIQLRKIKHKSIIQKNVASAVFCKLTILIFLAISVKIQLINNARFIKEHGDGESF